MTDSPITEVLRAALHAEQRKRSLLSIANEAGAEYSLVRRFSVGESQGIRSDLADKLAGALGMELRKIRKRA